MPNRIVITGIGMITPLGQDPREVLRRVESGESAAAPPVGFDASPFACPVCAQVKDFQPQRFVPEVKMLRLMNREAQLAVAAAHLALQDAGVKVGATYPSEAIALFGATGLAGLPLSEVVPLIKASTGPDNRFDLGRFGQAGLKAISPILSFKILGNMPVCFVSICENIQGPNCIYTPWEGQGAQAIESGIRAIQCGEARCALVGGCDVKTHELAFLSLEQQGFFRSWREEKRGVVPGEGAVFLVLEEEAGAAARGARSYARVAEWSFGTHQERTAKAETYRRVLRGLDKESFDHGLPPHPDPLPQWGRGEAPAVSEPPGGSETTHGGPRDSLSPSGGEGQGEGVAATPVTWGAIVAGADTIALSRQDEAMALSSLQLAAKTVIYPKPHAGNLFAAAAALQVALGAMLAERSGTLVLANCFGHGSEQAAFVLETP